MNFKTLFFTCLLFSGGQHLFAQNDYLKRINTFLVGPDNVDVFYDFQMEYYIEKYQIFREELLIDKKNNRETLQSLENKKFNNRHKRKQMEELEIENGLISSDLEKVDHYLDLWLTWKVTPNNQTFLKAYQPTSCYQIEGMDFTYFSGDYRMDTIEQERQIWWNEIVDEVMLDFAYELVEVEPAREEWVKKRADRNCLSADPNDCLVWCLVETPAKMDTIVIQAAKMGCMDGFFSNEFDSTCRTAIISEEKVEADLRVKVIDDLTGREIRIKGFEKVACE